MTEPDAHDRNPDYQMALTHMDRNQVDQALFHATRALDADFSNTKAALVLSACFMQKGSPGMAAVLAKFCIAGRSHTNHPQFPEAWRNLGSAFKMANRNQDAEGFFQQALKEEVSDVHRGVTYGCLGTCFVHAGQPQKALDYFNKGLELLPNSDELRYNRGLVQLEMGNWREGWRDLNHGFATGVRTRKTYGNLPEWDGTPGQTVIVWGEQGLGDEILFASCIPDMIKACGRVIFDCHPRLVDLYQRSFPEIQVYGTRKLFQFNREWIDEEKADAHICISNLPMHFRNELGDFPGTPYLKADPYLWPGRDSRFHVVKPRIGISWIGGIDRTRRDLRSMPLETWAPLLKAIDADFYSLQYTDGAPAEICHVEEQHGVRIHHLPGRVNPKNYDLTAGFVAALDLVITVTTTVCDLAGALGVPTIALVPRTPPWRYCAGLMGSSGSETSVWYKSVRYARQTGDDWGPVLERVTQKLAATMERAA